MKVELKRKQTTVDLLRSEKDRIQRYKEELEGITVFIICIIPSILFIYF